MTTEKYVKMRELPKKAKKSSNLMTITQLKIPPFLNIRIQVNRENQRVLIYLANGFNSFFQVLDPETDTQDLQLIAETIFGAIEKIEFYRDHQLSTEKDKSLENENP